MEERNREWAGTPSPAVAMFAAQSDFAGEMCPAAPEALKSRESLTKKVRHAGLMVDTYVTYPAFAQSLAKSRERYRAAWASMSANEKTAFCSEYYQELSTVNASMAHLDADALRMHFSPPSQAARDRQQAAGLLLGAASVAATAGGIAQVDNKNFDGAARLNSAGGVLANAIPGDISSPRYCPAYEHFTRHDAPGGHGTWKRYVSIRSCR